MPIVFNGQEYDSVDAMPPDVRKQYEDVMRLVADSGRGKVDSLLELGPLHRIVKVTTNVRTRIVVNGKEYHSVHEMPAHVRAAYERALGQAGGGTPSGRDPATTSQPTPALPPTAEDTPEGIASNLRRIGLWVLIAGLLGLWFFLRSRPH